MEADCEVQIILLGESDVGKTSLLHRFLDGKFKDRLPKTIINKYEKIFEIGDILVKLVLWDTDGRESYSNVVKRYYEIADGGLFVYDIQNADTLTALSKWLDDFKFMNKEAELLIVGNKSEDECKRSVNSVEAESFVQTVKLDYIEVSAKNDENINIVFRHLVQKILVSKGIIPYSKYIFSEKSKICTSSSLPVTEAQKNDSTTIVRNINLPCTSESLSTSVKSAEHHIAATKTIPSITESLFTCVESNKKFNASPMDKFSKTKVLITDEHLTEHCLNIETHAMNTTKEKFLQNEVNKLKEDEDSKDRVKIQKQDCGSIDSAEIAEDYFKVATVNVTLPQSQEKTSEWWLSSIHLSR